jgi:hypothetical protein
MVNESIGLMNVDVHKGGGKTKHNTMATKEVNPNLLLNACNISSPNNELSNKFHHLLMFDVNGLLCEKSNLKFGKKWRSIILVVR